jgi:L-amino acid N-acyltransferase YncA
MDYSIRKIKDDDGEGIIHIFNYFIDHGFAAYPETRVPTEFFTKFQEIAPQDTLYVVEIPEKYVVGFRFLKTFNPMSVFQRTAEISYFLLPNHTNKDVGTRLLQVLMKDAKQKRIDTLLTSASSHNKQSLRFHQKQGFVECGRFQRVGKKQGNDFDVVWMQKFL